MENVGWLVMPSLEKVHSNRKPAAAAIVAAVAVIAATVDASAAYSPT